MSVTYGFYNSHNGDRKYSAEDVSRIFDGLITDGIFKGFGDAFKITPGETGSFVSVGTGRAWFNHTWIYNDAPLLISFEDVPSGSKRIDAIVIDIDVVNRVNSIKVVTGDAVATGTPTRPTLTKGENGTSYQYPLCLVEMDPQSNYVVGYMHITNLIGLASEGTQFVTGVVESVSVDDFVAQWEAEFDSWLDYIKRILEDQVVTGGAEFANQLYEHETEINRNSSRLSDIEGQNDAVTHRNIYRGKYHGTEITEDQYHAIRGGYFEDIYVGDYWKFNDTVWRIVDIDYWIRSYGETRHHILLMPDEPIGNLPAKLDSEMSPISSTEGGYYHSNLSDSYATKEFLSKFADTPIAERLEYNDYIVDAVDKQTGAPTNGSWYEVKESVPSEIMMYGTRIWSYSNNASAYHLFTNSPSQLSAFRLNPRLIFCCSRYWLRDTVSATQFAMVLEGNGTANRAKAASSYGYRPIVMIG